MQEVSVCLSLIHVVHILFYCFVIVFGVVGRYIRTPDLFPTALRNNNLKHTKLFDLTWVYFTISCSSCILLNFLSLDLPSTYCFADLVSSHLHKSVEQELEKRVVQSWRIIKWSLWFSCWLWWQFLRTEHVGIDFRTHIVVKWMKSIMVVTIMG